MENFKDLLVITPKVCNDKNVVKIDATWDYNDADYDECHETFDANKFFKDKKLIWSLAYLDMFGTHVEDNDYIDFDTLYNVVSGECLWGFGCDDSAHSLEGLEITYYDDNCNPFNVTFDNIHKRWETMSEEDICKEVNDIIKKKK
jgi:hypothetical protein